MSAAASKADRLELVSVVIPTRNRLSMLRVALASALAQEGVAVEVIVVDEASSDATPAFLEAVQRSDSRVQVLTHEQPRKLPGARNAGLGRAQGRWVAFLDDDDVWHPRKLATQLAALHTSGARWSCVGVVNVDAELRPFHLVWPPPDVVGAITTHNPVPGGGSGVVADRSLVQALGGFDESLIAAEDWECWLRLAADGPPAVVAEPLLAYRVGAGSMSHDAQRMTDAFEQVATKHPEVTLDRPAARAETANYLGLQLARSGHRLAAARLLWGAGRRSPGVVVRVAWVIVTGLPWVRPNWSRPAAVRAELRRASEWLETVERAAGIGGSESRQ